MGKRAIRHRGRRGKKAPFELDITSLLDILVILLVFLLKTYSTNNVVINIPKEIVLPDSKSIESNTPGVVIQISKEKIWVDSNIIVDYANNPEGVKVYDHGKRLFVPLYDELVRVREEIELTNKQANLDQDFSATANLVVDKEITYIDVKRILYTAAEAGFKQYKFVVLGEEQF